MKPTHPSSFIYCLPLYYYPYIYYYYCYYLLLCDQPLEVTAAASQTQRKKNTLKEERKKKEPFSQPEACQHKTLDILTSPLPLLQIIYFPSILRKSLDGLGGAPDKKLSASKKSGKRAYGAQRSNAITATGGFWSRDLDCKPGAQTSLSLILYESFLSLEGSRVGGSFLPAV